MQQLNNAKTFVVFGLNLWGDHDQCIKINGHLKVTDSIYCKLVSNIRSVWHFQVTKCNFSSDQFETWYLCLYNLLLWVEIVTIPFCFRIRKKWEKALAENSSKWKKILFCHIGFANGLLGFSLSTISAITVIQIHLHTKAMINWYK